jgi:hypothetical protein
MADSANYFAIVEQTSPADNKVDIIEVKKQNNLNYLRFNTCLQAFIDERNRNRRKWIPKFVKSGVSSPEWVELLNNGGVPGENGHPIPATGQVTMERIATIDPNNISHLIKKVWWTDGELKLHGEIETVDDINGPGAKFMRHILQGLVPSFSNRAIIPQRRNPDGTIDQIGVGRIITFDRVILPSHKEAYRDLDVPVKNIIKTPKDMEVATECYNYIMRNSENVKRVIGDDEYALESASINNAGTMFGIHVDNEYDFIPVEEDIRKSIKNFMKNI